MRIEERLLEILKIRNKSVKDLANDVGMEYDSLFDKLRRKSELTISELERILDAMDLDLTLTRTDDPGEPVEDEWWDERHAEDRERAGLAFYDMLKNWDDEV